MKMGFCFRQGFDEIVEADVHFLVQ
jgi:hypothetical protein